MKKIVNVVTNITLTEVPGHSDILITIDEIGAGRARVQMQEGAQVSTAFWNTLGDKPLAEHIQSLDDSHLLGCFDQFGTQYRKILGTNAKQDLAAAINERVEAGQFSPEQAVLLTGRLTIFDTITDINGVQAIASELMVEIFGPGWHEYARPLLLGKHPHYTGLISRIQLLREALTQ